MDGEDDKTIPVTDGDDGTAAKLVVQATTCTVRQRYGGHVACSWCVLVFDNIVVYNAILRQILVSYQLTISKERSRITLIFVTSFASSKGDFVRG